jgi:eukaryotic-like serine/threonine-protein kinase
MRQEPLKDEPSSKDALIPTKIAGRYALFQPIASGGMATVYVGRLLGTSGFGRTVAIKCMHEHVARDPELVKSFLDEAQLAARIRHPNVVPTLDIVSHQGELFLVMDYVHGESLSRLLAECRARELRMPLAIASNVLTGALQGLHAAHELRDERGNALRVVHRDVSPQNVLVGTDGVTRVMDFGIAKATTSSAHTSTGIIKGKVSYMAPEQMTQRDVTPAVDIFAMGIVAWEMVVGRRLRPGRGDLSQILGLLSEQIAPPSSIDPDIPEGLSAIIMRALARDPRERPGSALVLAREIARVVPPATTWEVAEWVEKILGDRLLARSEMVQEVEIASGMVVLPPSIPPPRPSADAPAAEKAAIPPAPAVLPAPSARALPPLPAPLPPPRLVAPLPPPPEGTPLSGRGGAAGAPGSGEFELSRSLSMPGVQLALDAGAGRGSGAKRAGLMAFGLVALAAVPTASLWLMMRYAAPPYAGRSALPEAASIVAAMPAPCVEPAPIASPASPAAPAVSSAAPSASAPIKRWAQPPLLARPVPREPQRHGAASLAPRPDDRAPAAASTSSYSEQ